MTPESRKIMKCRSSSRQFKFQPNTVCIHPICIIFLIQQAISAQFTENCSHVFCVLSLPITSTVTEVFSKENKLFLTSQFERKWAPSIFFALSHTISCRWALVLEISFMKTGGGGQNFTTALAHLRMKELPNPRFLFTLCWVFQPVLLFIQTPWGLSKTWHLDYINNLSRLIWTPFSKPCTRPTNEEEKRRFDSPRSQFFGGSDFWSPDFF